MRTQRSIGEPPPTARQSEDRFGPQQRCGRVHKYDIAARCQESMQMAERLADITHRVQHIGADDEVERTFSETLLGAGLFEIENLALDLRKCGQLLKSA